MHSLTQSLRNPHLFGLACLQLFLLSAVTSPAIAGDNSFYKPGYEVEIYREAFSPRINLDKVRPAESFTVTEFKKDSDFDTKAPGDGFTVMEGFLDVGSPIDAWFKPGYGETTTAIMFVNGEKVYEKLPGAKEPTTSNISLQPGLHPYRIVYLTPIDSLLCFTNLGQRLGENHSRIQLAFTSELETELVDALTELAAHAAGEKKLSDQQISSHNQTLEQYKFAFGNSEAIIKAALDLVETHDANHAPLFTQNSTEWGSDGRDGLRWSVFQTMQHLLTYAYTNENLEKYPELLGSAKFATADKFPGPVTKPSDSSAEYTVPVWATFPADTPWTFWMGPRTARKPTGAYLAPGTIATVKVPETLVGKGFLIRVGAHANNLVNKRSIDRVWSISLLYPIDKAETQIANPMGGGIYLEVPEGVEAGEVELTFTNIVRAPFYSNTRVRKTSLDEWINVERKHPAPWVDFQSEAFMMQLPRTWVYNLEDPESVMNKWDKAVTAVVNVMGYTVEESGREVFYIQPDTQLRNSVFSPGHPQVNVGGADPEQDKYNGLKKTFHLTGPQDAPDWVFHEWGHALALAGPAGENETSNNFLHTTANHGALGQDLDEAFRNSRGTKSDGITLDNTAVNWMTALNFDTLVQQKSQKSYQYVGHAKYVDIGRLFGWDTLGKFYRTINDDRIAYRDSGGSKGEDWGKNIDNDRYIKRLSEVGGFDMRPLFHFWGTPPTSGLVLATGRERLEAGIAQANVDMAANRPDAPHGEKLGEMGKGEAKFNLNRYEELLGQIESQVNEVKKLDADYAAMLKSGKIKRSAKIYDQLVAYRELVPKDNAAFRAFARDWYGWTNEPPKKKPLWIANDHRKQWYRYDEESAEYVRSLITEITDFYFPEGRPAE